MAKIKIDYDNVVSQTRKISSLSNELKAVSSSFEKMVEQIPNFWDSPAAKVYKEQCVDLQNSIKSTVAQMDNISSDIRKMAENIKKEDEALAVKTKNLSK